MSSATRTSSPTTPLNGVAVAGNVVDTHGLTPVALAAEDDFVTLRVSAPSDSRERSAFTHGLTPVVLSGALIGTGHLLEANPLIYRMDDSNSWRSVHQAGET